VDLYTVAFSLSTELCCANSINHKRISIFNIGSYKMNERAEQKPGFKTVGVSLHTSVDGQLKQLAKQCGVSKSAFIADLIKNYGSAQKKKYLPEA
jgi:hypothetical protein